MNKLAVMIAVTVVMFLNHGNVTAQTKKDKDTTYQRNYPDRKRDADTATDTGRRRWNQNDTANRKMR